jgi:hypothetical protein
VYAVDGSQISNPCDSVAVGDGAPQAEANSNNASEPWRIKTSLFGT